jgi:hypothetical protein
MAINVSTNFEVRWNKQQLIETTQKIKNAIKNELNELKEKQPKVYEQLKAFIDNIHPVFFSILTPLMCIDNIDAEMYQATLRIYLKDKGPSIYGYLQKILLSVSESKEEIERALNFIDRKQQAIIDLKKAEHSLVNYNEALKAKAKKFLEQSEVKDLYEKWKAVDCNWSKNKWKLILYGQKNDELDELASIVHKICYD